MQTTTYAMRRHTLTPSIWLSCPCSPISKWVLWIWKKNAKTRKKNRADTTPYHTEWKCERDRGVQQPMQSDCLKGERYKFPYLITHIDCHCPPLAHQNDTYRPVANKSSWHSLPHLKHIFTLLKMCTSARILRKHYVLPATHMTMIIIIINLCCLVHTICCCCYCCRCCRVFHSSHSRTHMLGHIQLVSKTKVIHNAFIFMIVFFLSLLFSSFHLPCCTCQMHHNKIGVHGLQKCNWKWFIRCIIRNEVSEEKRRERETNCKLNDCNRIKSCQAKSSPINTNRCINEWITKMQRKCI